MPQADQDFLDDRGPCELLTDITAPTLLIQGTVDTLFTLQEAHENAIALIGNRVPTKVVWYCGGHGACISSTNDGEVIERATLDWLDRYVKGDLSVKRARSSNGSISTGGSTPRANVPGATGRSAGSIDRGGRCAPWFWCSAGRARIWAFAPGPIGGLLGMLSGAKPAMR